MFFNMDRETCETLERIMEGMVAKLRQRGRSNGRVIRRTIPV